MRKLPVSPWKLAAFAREARHLAESPGRIIMLGADAEALASVRRSLASGASEAAAGNLMETVTGEGAGLPAKMNGSAGIVIFVAAHEELSSGGLGERLGKVRRAGVPAVVVLTQAPGVEVSFPAAGVAPRRVVGMAPGGVVAEDVLAEAVVDAMGDAVVPLAARLPVLRNEACRQLIRKTARQNAVVGALFFLPGSDMPVMTLNEAKMVLKIAAAHNESIGAERLLELLGLAGTGFGLRAAARQVLDFMPGPGWVIKSGIAYGGTRTLGEAAQAYFNGAVRITPSRLAPVIDRVKRLKGNV